MGCFQDVMSKLARWTWSLLTVLLGTGCEPADDVATPGDDRAGYFWCVAEPEQPGVTCPPDSLCCLTGGPICVSHEQGCADPLNVVTCDGPEDCPGAGNHCETQTHDRSCTSSEGIFTWCHTDQDCVNVFESLPEGVCEPSGVCDFSGNATLAQ